MVDLKTHEHLIYFMLKNLRLSRYDSRFLENLEKMIATTHRVTSNQVSLFEKLISKYQRQLIKHGLFIDVLVNLSWNTTIVKTTQEYTSAHIGILEDSLIFKTPYNKLFINEFRNSSQSCFVWDNTHKYYIGDLSTYSLKLATTIAKKFFEVRYSDKVNQLLTQLSKYDKVTHWVPTLTQVNGNYLIVASNQSLDKAIQHIPLDKHPATLSELVRYGVHIDKNMLTTDEELFAAEFNPSIELDDLDKIVPWLESMGCDYVYVSGTGLSTAVKIKNDFKGHLQKAGIRYTDNSTRFIKSVKEKYKFPVAVRYRLIPDFNEPTDLAKVINIVNSQPINLNKNETM